MTDICADTTGMLWKLLVKEGDNVAAGDTVAILESMKMEIPVEATSERSRVIPALLTSPSTPLKADRTSAAAVLQDIRLLTSSSTAMAAGSSPRTSASTSWTTRAAAAASRSAMATWAPRVASSTAVARPMPEAPPVTT
jgi:acetyl-CoA carboxylase biotin carboxyl carrier protein